MRAYVSWEVLRSGTIDDEGMCVVWGEGEFEGSAAERGACVVWTVAE